MRLAIILIHYHTEKLLADCIARLLASDSPAEVEAEIIVVDNGSTEDLGEHLSAFEYRLLQPGQNLGYAGGINLAIDSTDADLYCVMNPDVLVDPSCIPLLAQAAQQHQAIVGPRLFLDPDHQIMLPCTEARTRACELARALSGWHPILQRHARRRWRRHARRYWRSSNSMPCDTLSGAMLMFSRSAWQRVGPFDTRFKLYYEETDWLRRARAQGIRSLLIPTATARHLYNQSAVQEPRAAGWMRESARLFSRRYYGPLFTRMIDALRRPGSEPGLASRHVDTPPQVDLRELVGSTRELWLELAAYPQGYPAAEMRLTGVKAEHWTIPDEVWALLAPGPYIVQLVDEAGRERHREILIKPSPGPRQQPQGD